MQATLNSQPAVEPTSKPMLWVGRILSTLAVLFLVMDGAMKVVNVQPVIDASIALGLPIELAPQIGAILLVCVAIYLVPHTAVLGALLLTGFLGGAIAMQVRIGAPLFSLVFPIILGAMIWGGLALRNKEVRSLLLHL